MRSRKRSRSGVVAALAVIDPTVLLIINRHANVAAQERKLFGRIDAGLVWDGSMIKAAATFSCGPCKQLFRTMPRATSRYQTVNSRTGS
jgi:hypothetical protein